VRGEGMYSPEVLSECLHSIHDCVIIEKIDYKRGRNGGVGEEMIGYYHMCT
jgi:hypothetical protein